ncbi:MAG: hypothetical protein KAG87_02615 [Marinobacter adhaerens]|nr:hypothetical protein [Marinobacter adhaerens]
MKRHSPEKNEVKGYAVDYASVLIDEDQYIKSQSLSVDKKRIVYLTGGGRPEIIAFNTKNRYHQIIFKSFAIAFQSRWFASLSQLSKPNYFTSARKLCDWVNESGYRIKDGARYSILKDYESYEMNIRGRRSSPLSLITTTVRESLSDSSLSKEEHEYLRVLLSLSKPARSSESESSSLSGWFAVPWLRPILGEKRYLQLESPRLLFTSFRATIAITLLWLLERRSYWRSSTSVPFDCSKPLWQYDWNRMVLRLDASFNEDCEPADDYSQLIWMDLVKPICEKSLKEAIADKGLLKLRKSVKVNGLKKYPWQNPVLFHPDYRTQYSPVEELLCAWLVACQAIQSSDIPKLKKQNFAIEVNRLGRLIAMECTYYKGRAGGIRKPAMQMGNEPWTIALNRYIGSLSSDMLFRHNVTNVAPLTIGSRNTTFGMIFKIWKLSSFQEHLRSELKRLKTSSLFISAILSLEEGSESCAQFLFRTGKKASDYRESVSRPLPPYIFSLTHIKTTAVYAGSDTYREGDLINHHSHSSLTEKSSYLSDANKEWVNQCGRITRLVLNDLRNVVFNPSINEISLAVEDLKLRTRVIDATCSEDGGTNKLISPREEIYNDDVIIVLDTTDNALYFIHYLAQAEEMLPELVSRRPDWVERTLIVKVEWMTSVLMRMKSAAVAKKSYPKLKFHFPPLFDHLIGTTE